MNSREIFEETLLQNLFVQLTNHDTAVVSVMAETNAFAYEEDCSEVIAAYFGPKPDRLSFTVWYQAYGDQDEEKIDRGHRLRFRVEGFARRTGPGEPWTVSWEDCEIGPVFTDADFELWGDPEIEDYPWRKA